jgi:hypothetical protein
LTAKNSQVLKQWLQEGIIAAKAGQLEQARFRLLDVVEQDQTNETAWYWLYQVFDRRDDKRVCLENLIIINPHNQWAKEELLRYLEAQSPTDVGFQADDVAPDPATMAGLKDQTDRKAPAYNLTHPITLRLVAAFWVGISLIFLGSGIISAGGWLLSNLNGQDFPNQLTTFQIFELLISIIFIAAGISGLAVAIALFSESMVGFYGSILLALGLLLVGPTVSLITAPPNYLTMICTGGISGMIVLLTLASQVGFKNTAQNDNTFN